PEGASTPDGVGCRIGRGYSVFARKGKPIAWRWLRLHSLRHAGLDPASIAAAKSWTPDQVRGDEEDIAHACPAPRAMPHPFGLPDQPANGGSDMIILPISLTIAAGAALLNLWL